MSDTTTMGIDDTKVKDAYWEGYRAYQDDLLNSDDNPYNEQTEESDILWNSWRDGYFDAAWDD